MNIEIILCSYAVDRVSKDYCWNTLCFYAEECVSKDYFWNDFMLSRSGESVEGLLCVGSPRVCPFIRREGVPRLLSGSHAAFCSSTGDHMSQQLRVVIPPIVTVPWVLISKVVMVPCQRSLSDFYVIRLQCDQLLCDQTAVWSGMSWHLIAGFYQNARLHVIRLDIVLIYLGICVRCSDFLRWLVTRFMAFCWTGWYTTFRLASTYLWLAMPYWLSVDWGQPPQASDCFCALMLQALHMLATVLKVSLVDSVSYLVAQVCLFLTRCLTRQYLRSLDLYSFGGSFGDWFIFKMIHVLYQTVS